MQFGRIKYIDQKQESVSSCFQQIHSLTLGSQPHQGCPTLTSDAKNKKFQKQDNSAFSMSIFQIYINN